MGPPSLKVGYLKARISLGSWLSDNERTDRSTRVEAPQRLQRRMR